MRIHVYQALNILIHRTLKSYEVCSNEFLKYKDGKIGEGLFIK